MTDNVIPLRDPNTILRNAVIEARGVLAVYTEPGGPDAKRTISRLMRIFDNPRSSAGGNELIQPLAFIVSGLHFNPRLQISSKGKKMRTPREQAQIFLSRARELEKRAKYEKDEESKATLFTLAQ